MQARVEVHGSTPAELRLTVEKDYQVLGGLMREFGIKPRRQASRAQWHGDEDGSAACAVLGWRYPTTRPA